MFKQILEALTHKYQGVDARILTRMARKLAKTVKSEDEVQEAVDGVTVMDLIDMEGNRRASAATENAVKDYEQKYNLKDGKSVAAPAAGNGRGDDNDPNGDDDDDEPTGDPVSKVSKGGSKGGHRQSKLEAQIAALTETVSTLTGTIKGMQQERTAKTRRQQYEELFEGVDEKVKNRYMRNFDRLSFKDDTDFNEWLEDMTPQVTEELKQLPPTDQNPGTQPGGNGTTTPAQRRGVTPPLGGTSHAAKGQLSPEFQRYQAKQQARMRMTQYSTMAGLPQQMQGIQASMQGVNPAPTGGNAGGGTAGGIQQQ